MKKNKDMPFVLLNFQKTFWIFYYTFLKENQSLYIKIFKIDIFI